MKKIVFISLTLLFSVAAFAITDASATLIKSAITSSDINKIEVLFSESCNVSMFGENKKFSKAQTIEKLSKFLAENPVKNYKVIHKGINDRNSFLIVTFNSGNKSYRIHILAYQKEKKDIINQIRIENNNE